MTSYITITDAETDPSAPLTSELAKKWRDNPIAITEGATGAPRIVGSAIKRLADMPVLTVSASDDFVIDGSLTTSIGGATSTASTTFVVAATITITKGTGSARFKASHATNGSQTSFLRLLKNGVEVTSWTTDSTSFVNRSVDVSIVPGDVFEWQHRIASSFNISSIGIIQTSASDAYTTRQALLPFSAVATP